jgi:GDP-L-fucose synthase
MFDNMSMNKNSKIYVAGHRGLVGSALTRALKKGGYTNLIMRTHQELDLTRQADVEHFFMTEKPEYVFLAAAKVGGIMANNTYPAEFIYQNLVIETNIIESARKNGVKKLLFLGSSCIYPKFAPQPMKEEHLLTGTIEPTNEPYALAKIAGIKMCQSYNRQYGTNFVAVMPTNLYGPNDNFDLTSSHVLPALIRKFHEAKEAGAKEVVAWGTGSPKREFLHVDDLAEACLFVMNKYNPTKEENEKGSIFMNLGTGEDISIKELTEMIKEVVEFKGKIVWDTTKPDGTPRKLLDVSKINNLGWKSAITLENGIRTTYEWFLGNFN